MLSQKSTICKCILVIIYVTIFMFYYLCNMCIYILCVILVLSQSKPDTLYAQDTRYSDETIIRNLKDILYTSPLHK